MHVQNTTLNYPYAPKDPPLYSGAFNHFYYYFNKHNAQPNFFESRIKIQNSIINDLKNVGAEQLFIHHSECKDNTNNKKIDKLSELVFEYKDSIIVLLSSPYDNNYNTSIWNDADEEHEKFTKYFCKILYKDDNNLNEIKSLFKYVEERNKKNVYLVCKSDGMLITQKFKVKLPSEDIDLELNYGKELETKKEVLIKKPVE